MKNIFVNTESLEFSRIVYNENIHLEYNFVNTLDLRFYKLR